MKKMLSSALVLIFGFLLITPVLAQTGVDSAQNALGDIAGQVGINIDTDNAEAGIAQIVGSIIKALLAILGVVFMTLTIYGGWLWMTAAGNQERVNRAKDLLRDSIFGIIIVVAAYAITTFVIAAITSAITPIAP